MFKKNKNRGKEIFKDSSNKLEILKYKHLNEKDSIFENNKCLCGSNEYTLITNEDRYGIPECNFVICKDCGLIRMNPYYNNRFLEDFYKNYYSIIYRGGHICTEDEFNNVYNRAKKNIVSLVSNHIKINELKIFEIGAGSGANLFALKEQGAEVYGCDYDVEYSSLAKEKGITIVNGDYEELKKFGKCDLLILNHVLEHIINPIEFLKNIRELIKDNGMIYIAVPTIESIPDHYNFDMFIYFQSAHIYSFSDSIFIKYVESTGFDLIDEQGYKEILLRKTNNFKSFIPDKNECKNNILYLSLFEHIYNLNNIIKFYKDKSNNLENYINSLAWWIPIKKWRDNLREKILYRTEQNRTEQNRTEQR